MEWISRWYESKPVLFFKPGKVAILYGARRVGKTMLIKRMLANRTERIFSSTGEDMDLVDILTTKKIETYRLFFNPYDIIFIDEAQYIPRMGECLKLLVDIFPEKYFIISGSSALTISQSASEPLTGRGSPRVLYPLAILELITHHTPFDILKNLETYLLYGMYPEIFSINNIHEKIEYLIHLRNSYLFKDIFALEQIKNSQKLQDILRLLALQIGSEVSLNEIARITGLSKNTVERYIDLLEKAFIIKKLTAFSRNLRNEISKSAKYYFWDTGVRNAVINNFNRLEIRNDVGALWENFIIMELIKKHEYTGTFAQFYFWRTYDQKEIDLIIEAGGALTAYEIKWQSQRIKTPTQWLETYKTPVNLISRDNLFDVLLEPTPSQ